MSPASLDWAVCDFAIWVAGAVTVPVYETSSAEQVRWVLSDSGAVAVFAGDAQCAALIRQAQVPGVEVVWAPAALTAWPGLGRRSARRRS